MKERELEVSATAPSLLSLYVQVVYDVYTQKLGSGVMVFRA